jgi:hypothetical protein
VFTLPPPPALPPPHPPIVPPSAHRPTQLRHPRADRGRRVRAERPQLLGGRAGQDAQGGACHPQVGVFQSVFPGGCLSCRPQVQAAPPAHSTPLSSHSAPTQLPLSSHSAPLFHSPPPSIPTQFPLSSHQFYSPAEQGSGDLLSVLPAPCRRPSACCPPPCRRPSPVRSKLRVGPRREELIKVFYSAYTRQPVGVVRFRVCMALCLPQS